MNWEIVSSTAEIVGALAVVVSLLYLASQLRQNTVAMKTTSAAGAARAMREITATWTVDPVLSGLVSRGFEDPGSLNADERAWLATDDETRYDQIDGPAYCKERPGRSKNLGLDEPVNEPHTLSGACTNYLMAC